MKKQPEHKCCQHCTDTGHAPHSEGCPAEPVKDLAYYLTLFKVKGHTTWRAHLGVNKEAAAKQFENDHHNVTDMMQLRIDRIDGTFRPL